MASNPLPEVYRVGLFLFLGMSWLQVLVHVLILGMSWVQVHVFILGMSWVQGQVHVLIFRYVLGAGASACPYL